MDRWISAARLQEEVKRSRCFETIIPRFDLRTIFISFLFQF